MDIKNLKIKFGFSYNPNTQRYERVFATRERLVEQAQELFGKTEYRFQVLTRNGWRSGDFVSKPMIQ